MVIEEKGLTEFILRYHENIQMNLKLYYSFIYQGGVEFIKTRLLMEEVSFKLINLLLILEKHPDNMKNACWKN